MPALLSIDDFLDLVRKCGAVDSRKLEGFVGQHRAAGTLPDEPSSLAQMLIEAGLLTKFQAEPLVQGKPRRFLISGKYKLLDRLGAGGMASVYLCEHRIMRRRVAIKILPPSMAKNPSSLERFHREARASAALDHPNIVRAHDVDNDGNMHFLVVEYIDGTDLANLVKKSGPLAFERACHYIAQAASGLHAANLVGLVHRDIKPANLLLDRYGVIKILDLGLALFFHDEEDELTKEHDNNSVLGTADYLAPEQAIDSHGVDIRADIYSLGATFYYLLTGSAPFAGGTIAQKLVWHHMRAVKPVRDIRPDVPEEIDEIIQKMMAKDREERYQTPREVVEALSKWTRTPIAPPTEDEMPTPLAPLVLDPSMSEYNLPSISMPAAIDETSEVRQKVPASERTERIPAKPAPAKPAPKSSTSIGSSSAATMTAVNDRTPGPVKNSPKVRGKATKDDSETSDSGVPRKKGKKAAADESKNQQKNILLAFALGVLVVIAIGVNFFGGSSEEPPPTYNGPVVYVPPQPVPPVAQPKPVPKQENKVPPKEVKKETPKVEPKVTPKVEPKGEPKVEPKVPPMPMPMPPVPVQVTTAEFFFPNKVGTSLFYDMTQPTPSGTAVARRKFDFLEGGKIDVTTVRIGQLKSKSLLNEPNVEWMPREVKQKLGSFVFRVGTESIEFGETDPKKKDVVNWEPVLKLNAKAGENWKMQLPNGEFKTYTIEKFDKNNNRDAVVVKDVMNVPGGELVTTHTFVKDVGEVTRTQVFVPKAGANPVVNQAAPMGGNEPKLVYEMKLVD